MIYHDVPCLTEVDCSEKLTEIIRENDIKP